MDFPHGLWWCTRRISHDCQIMVKVHPHIPYGAMCHACTREIHRYDVSTAKGHPKWAHIRRIQHKRRKGHQNYKKAAQALAQRLCSYDGCRRPVYRGVEFGVVFEHRFLCYDHWKHGEDMAG